MQMHPPWVLAEIAGASRRDEEADVQMLWPEQEAQELKHTLPALACSPSPTCHRWAGGPCKSGTVTGSGD